MELCDLGDEGSVAAVASAAAAELERPDLDADAAALADACWRSAPVRAAAAAGPGAAYRELPIGALVDGVVVSGAIDLVYRDGDAWVVVDYKTDRAAEPEVLRDATSRRAPPMRSPSRRPPAAWCARSASSPRARTGSSCACRSNKTNSERERARGEVGAAAAAGRALRPDELGGHPA